MALSSRTAWVTVGEKEPSVVANARKPSLGSSGLDCMAHWRRVRPGLKGKEAFVPALGVHE